MQRWQGPEPESARDTFFSHGLMSPILADFLHTLFMLQLSTSDVPRTKLKGNAALKLQAHFWWYRAFLKYTILQKCIFDTNTAIHAFLARDA